MPTRNIPLADAGPRVADVMMREPRAVGPATTADEARATFENPRVRLLLVAEGDRFLGAVTRAHVGDGVPGDAPRGELAAEAALVGPDEPVARVVELLDADESDRLPVVASDGTLVGLICFNRRHGHFCVDAGAPDRRHGAPRRRASTRCSGPGTAATSWPAGTAREWTRAWSTSTACARSGSRPPRR